LPEGRKELQLLLKVLDDLKEFLPYLVLVGGWVPYLYVRYLWKGIQHEPLTTVDIDFGFKNGKYSGGETIADRVRKKHYGEHHVSIDRDIPFVPVVRLEKGDLRADVEFITAPETSERVRVNLIGREIKINEIENFGILLESPIELGVEGRQINVPQPSIFIFHKLLTFIQRENRDKQQKDLYYAYYLLFFSPEREKLVEELSQRIANSKQGERVKQNILTYFEDPNAKGPTLIMEGTGGTAIRTFVSNIRQDAHERIFALVRG